MELRTLRYFLAAAQEENITRAADILHVTQPTLSRQIMDLERELGVTLTLRGKNGLKLTDDGIFFRQRAQRFAEQLHFLCMNRNFSPTGTEDKPLDRNNIANIPLVHAAVGFLTDVVNF